MSITARRPGIFLTTEWQHILAMLSYAVEPELLAPHLPEGVELDLWNGRPFVSLVGFVFRNTRLLGVPIPFYRNFPELNLRFYVRRPDEPNGGTGVVFIREIVARRAVSLMARLVYNENFRRLPMRSQIVPRQRDGAAGPTVAYAWRLAGAWNRLRMECAGQARRPASGSLEEFVVEREWGYGRRPRGGTLKYQVEHSPWNVWQPTRTELQCNAEKMYGRQWVPILASEPDSAILVDGSAIVLRRGVALEATEARVASETKHFSLSLDGRGPG